MIKNNMNIKNIKNIVFSGGAFKGWAYIGTLRALDELVDNSFIENVAGTSIGSVFGLFYILKIPWSVILTKIMNLTFSDMIDINNINTIISIQSIIKGVKFKEYISSIIAEYINPEVTFNELYKLNKITFTVTSLNINKGEIEYFNFINTPSVKVMDSIVASCSVPLLFPPYCINNNYYCDGGLCNNFPTNLYEDINTMGFTLFDENNNKSMNKLKKITIIDIINCLVDTANKIYKQKRENIFYILNDSFENQTYNLKQTKDDVFTLYINGYKNSYKVIYDNFIAINY